MGDKVNLKRPDGSILQVDASEVPQFTALGFKEETLEEQGGRTAKAGHEDYYSSGWEKAKTVIEGLGSGVTLGFSDKLLEWTTDAGITGSEWRDRAAVNPGTRLASELVGAIAPAFVSGGALTPAGALPKAAAAATKGIEGAVTRGAARGAIEGAGFALGGEVSRSALTGDPLTVESAMAGMGWGALFGGGLGALAGGIEGRIQAKAAQRTALEEAAAAQEARFILPEEKWGAFNAAVKDTVAKSEGAFKAAGDALEREAGLVSRIDDSVAARGKAALEEAGGVRNTRFNEPWMESLGMAKTEKKAAIQAYNDMKAALKADDWAGLEKASATFSEHLKKIDEVRAGYVYAGASDAALPALKPFKLVEGTKARMNTPAAMTEKVSQEALEQLKDLGAIGTTLKNFAQTSAGFTQMTPAKFDKMAGALETFMKQPGAEFAAAQNGLKQSIQGLASHVGVATEGNAVAQLRGVYETLRESKKAKATKDTLDAIKDGPSWMKQRVAQAAGLGTAMTTKTGWLGYQAGKSIAAGLLGVKGAVLGTLNVAKSWVPGGAKAAKQLSPQIGSLAIRLDGTSDVADKHKSSIDLMVARAKEIREAAPNVRDTLYRGLGGLDLHHPDFAVEAHKLAIKQFQFLYNKLPRDPGNAFSNLETLHKPDPVQVAKFARYYAVFQNPMGVIADGLANKRTLSQEESEGLQAMWPALFNELRIRALEAISDPAIAKKMSYEDQVHMSALTGLRLHSTLTPQFVASQQQMFMERNKPLQTQAQPGAPGSSGGRPSPDSPYATQAQRSTER